MLAEIVKMSEKTLESIDGQAMKSVESHAEKKAATSGYVLVPKNGF